MSAYQILADGLRFPEGPIAMADGSVIVVEIARGTLSRVAPDGSVDTVADLGGGPNGAAIGPDGQVYVCNNGGFVWHETDGTLLPGFAPAFYSGGNIQRIDLATRLVTTLYTRCGDVPLNGPNDLVFDHSGGFWFTDSGKRYARSEDVGAVYYAKSDGSFISEQLYPCSSPNGIALSPNGEWLYVAETMSGRIWRYAVSEPGKLRVPPGWSNPEALFYSPAGLALYGSMAVEANGNLCVGTLGQDGGITVISPEGELIERISLPDIATTNIAFGGTSLKKAYITLSSTGKLATIDWPRPGLRLHFSS